MATILSAGLMTADLKMVALIKTGQELASEHELRPLLEKSCRAAREIIAARGAAIGILEESGKAPLHVYASNVSQTTGSTALFSPSQDILETILQKRACRFRDPKGDPQNIGFPTDFPPTYSFLGVPVAFRERVLGWLCLTSKLGAVEFTDEDERLATIIAEQTAIAYQNARLYRERTAQLHTANAELEAFAYSVSHDLRAPLRHVEGFANLLLERQSGQLDETSLHCLRSIAESSATMTRQIADLLARLSLPCAELEAQRVELSHVVRNVQYELATATQHRNITWSIGPLPAVAADPDLLQLVWVNLLSNAIKFTATRDAARIEIGATCDQNGEAVIFVRDNGVGFDMKQAHKLFGVFQRLHRDDEFEGTGIGLATVRHIIHRHGGHVWADGQEGRGATFYFSLKTAQKIELLKGLSQSS